MRVCSLQECTKKHEARGYCTKHYQRLIKKGSATRRVSHEKNTYNIVGNTVYVDLRSLDTRVMAQTILDLTDWEELKSYVWWRNGTGYAESSAGRMHRLILCPGSSMFTDHINRDRLDNRRCNLRAVDNRLNTINAKRHKSRSGFKGVSYRKETGKFRARINYFGNTITLGVFNSALEAAKAYDSKALELYGEYAAPNLTWPTDIGRDI